MMKRRDALKRISIGMGYSLSAASLASLLSACRSEASQSDSNTWTPAFFSKTQGRVMEQMLELMFPATDTPGAKDLELTALIDKILNDVYSLEDQEKFRQGMSFFFNGMEDEKMEKLGSEELNMLLDKHLGQQVSPEEQGAIRALIAADTPPEDATQKSKYHRYQFLNTLRTLAISGYFTSEQIATEHLNYDPVPGPYQGCIPASDVGTTWALS